MHIECMCLPPESVLKWPFETARSKFEACYFKAFGPCTDPKAWCQSFITEFSPMLCGAVFWFVRRKSLVVITGAISVMRISVEQGRGYRKFHFGVV